MTTSFETYITKVETDYRGGKATEHTYRGTLEIFMESLERGIEASNDPKHIECGAPDFIVEKRKVPLGYVETKDVGEATEFTIGNLVVEWDNKLFTPPLSCGLLAGTFRAHLLGTGEVAERTIRVEELNDCTQIFMVNSVRKWQKVEITTFSIFR